MVDITVRELSLVGQVLGAAMRSGPTKCVACVMEVAQKREAMVEARSLAAEDARQKAEHLASLHGVQIGPVLKISEGGRGAGSPRQGDGNGCAIGADKRAGHSV